MTSWLTTVPGKSSRDNVNVHALNLKEGDVSYQGGGLGNSYARHSHTPCEEECLVLGGSKSGGTGASGSALPTSGFNYSGDGEYPRRGAGETPV